MKNLAKILKDNGKETTKLYKKVKLDYDPNYIPWQSGLTNEVANLSSKEKNQLKSMKFKEASVQNMVNVALAPVQETIGPRGERW